MNVGLLLITHNDLGRNLLETASSILGNSPINARAVSVPGDCDPDKILAEAGAICDELDQGDGILVLTDLFGSTPSNIATRLLDNHHMLVISGASVPMLIRILNYPSCSLGELGNKALSGARDGILATTRKQAS
ncbi:MAG: PTS fructose transporter subunit IIA [Pseudomonadota bacterium]|nr:PTS fructose transporter subunit IIA [Pseudomonadota bacterium]